MYMIGRYQEGVVLNPMEYLAGKNGKTLVFKTKANARKLLKKHKLKEEEDGVCIVSAKEIS